MEIKSKDSNILRDNDRNHLQKQKYNLLKREKETQDFWHFSIETNDWVFISHRITVREKQNIRKEVKREKGVKHFWT